MDKKKKQEALNKKKKRDLKAGLYAGASKGKSPSAGTRSAKSDKTLPWGFQGDKAVFNKFKSDQKTMNILKSGKNKNAKKNKY